MAKSRQQKSPAPPARRARPGYQRITGELSDGMAGRLACYCRYLRLPYGTVIEDALKIHLRDFYVVLKPTGRAAGAGPAAPEPLRLAAEPDRSPASSTEGQEPSAA